MGFLDALKDMFTLDSFYAPETTSSPVGVDDNATTSIGAVESDPRATRPDLSVPRPLKTSDVAEQAADALRAEGALPGLDQLVRDTIIENGAPLGTTSSHVARADQPTQVIKRVDMFAQHNPDDTVRMSAALLQKGTEGLPYLGQPSQLPDLDKAPKVPDVGERAPLRPGTVQQVVKLLGSYGRSR